MAALIAETQRQFVAGIEIFVDLHIDLLPVDVAFQALLSSDNAVSPLDPAELRLIQTVAPTEVIWQRHAVDHPLNESRCVYRRPVGIAAKHADCLHGGDSQRRAGRLKTAE